MLEGPPGAEAVLVDDDEVDADPAGESTFDDPLPLLPLLACPLVPVPLPAADEEGATSPGPRY